MLHDRYPRGTCQKHPRGGGYPGGNLGDETEGDTAAPPRMGVEQRKARKREIEEARIQLVQECAELDREIERHGEGGRTRAMARDVNRRIITDDEALPRFAQASQNISAMMALLHGLLEDTTLKDRQAHHEIRMLLERAAAQQAESSLSR